MWKKPILIIAVTLLLISPVMGDELTGKSIIDEQKKRHQSDNEFSDISITLVDRKGKQKKQRMVMYLSKKDGKSKTLIQYHKPANIRGVGLLTWEQGKDREDDQWLYMSASKSTKRIAGGSKKNQFMGTDMAFEDMRPENTENHAYTLVGEEIIFEKICWRIESNPSTEKEKADSGYGKRIMWVDKANYFNLKIDYYNHHDRHIKTALFEQIKPIKGQLFRSFKVTWKRLRQKTTTIMVYGKIDLDTIHKSIIFTKNYMKRPVK